MRSRVEALAQEYRAAEARAREQHDNLYKGGEFGRSDGFRVIAGWHARFARDLERLLEAED